MGFFTSLQPYLAGNSIAIVVTQAKEGKNTVMIYPTNQKDEESFIPVTITDTPEVLDDNIDDFMAKYLQTAVDHFSSSKVELTSKSEPAKKSPGKDDKKKHDDKPKAQKDEKPEAKAEPKPEPPKQEPAPDLFNTIEDPEELNTDLAEVESGNDIDEF